MVKYYVYILQSLSDGSFYTGYTADLERRLENHNSGGSIYTSRKTPWKIVYTEEYYSKTEALRRERFLKAQKNRLFFERIIQRGN